MDEEMTAPCPACRGTGARVPREDAGVCPLCRGTGRGDVVAVSNHRLAACVQSCLGVATDRLEHLEVWRLIKASELVARLVAPHLHCVERCDMKAHRELRIALDELREVLG